LTEGPLRKGDTKERILGEGRVKRDDRNLRGVEKGGALPGNCLLSHEGRHKTEKVLLPILVKGY